MSDKPLFEQSEIESIAAKSRQCGHIVTSKSIVDIVEERMRRYFAGDPVKFNGPGLTYGEMFRDAAFPAPTLDETIRRCVGVNEARLKRTLTDVEVQQIRTQLLTDPEGAYFAGVSR